MSLESLAEKAKTHYASLALEDFIGEGNVYYTVEDGKIIESIWDDCSTEIFDLEKIYYVVYKGRLVQLHLDQISTGELSLAWSRKFLL